MPGGWQQGLPTPNTDNTMKGDMGGGKLHRKGVYMICDPS